MVRVGGDDECGLRPKKPMLEENHDAGGMPCREPSQVEFVWG